ncbi:YceH family protein [Salinisphaera sp. Q1T1-3]|uniref:YceH family protein n=1 Tax=Salinisphaera sp. Q1T1-3 TaxID=2321229 RepID=UPI000E755D9D|nr:DUF480 domain-containing protein [Salinisphaera sp. Q1T1-3]RJS91350.1 DUF480 domain-containing protein [Salinisphaera sp. Q1T1-3]
MLPELTATEARLMGCLMEKSVTTPDQYPLTLNALTNAANQKSSREPVMSLTRIEVQRAARALAERRLIHIEENFKNGVEKYKQRLFGASSFADIRVDAPQFAIVTLLLLRGPATPGELRSRAGRLHTFTDNQAVAEAAADLIETDDPENSLLVTLPRRHGRKEAEFAHQLCGRIDPDTLVSDTAADSGTASRVAELERRIAELEAENADLRARLATR